MKKFISLAVAVTLLISCGKQQTDEERKAEVDREVQQRLDAEHQAADQQKLAQDKADLDAREKTLAEKESATANAPAAEAPVSRERTEGVSREIPESRGPKSYDMFYTKLERFGDWRETSDYGYVWQPREAQSREWRPYTNGHWVYSDAGWTWVSEEPFGWATYHYGRWARLRGVGWVWVPGDEWAPAWVSWRTSNEYVGWAPLPPEARFDRQAGIHKWADNYYDIGPDQYSFVAQKEFGSQRVERSVVPVERNVMIVNQTTNVTNITYSNTTVVNQGPSYDEMRARSQEPIQRYRLERRSEVNDESSRAVVRGEVLEVTAPSITAEITQRPRTNKAPLLQVTVERDWGTSDQAARQQARAKMKAEAAPPANAPVKTFVKPPQAAEGTRSTSLPAATTAASAAQAPSASATLPAATIAATPTQAPSASATVATSSHRAKPQTSATVGAAATPIPAATAAATAMPRPTFTPRPIETATTPSPSPNMRRRMVAPGSVPPASDSTSPSPGASPSPVESPKQDAAQSGKPGDRPRVQSQALKLHPRRNELMNSPSPGATSAPNSAPSPSEEVAVPAGSSKKEEKKNRKREEASGSNKMNASPTPTATPAP
jgi:hypothetical protein